MRKVVLRWNLSTIQGAKELGHILQICQRFEVLAHLGVSPVGIVQLAEIVLQDGKEINESETSILELTELVEDEASDESDGVACAPLVKRLIRDIRICDVLR